MNLETEQFNEFIVDIVDLDHDNKDTNIDSDSETLVPGFLEKMEECEIHELESTIEDLIHQYIEDHFIKWAETDFIDKMIADITQLILPDIIDSGVWCDSDEDELTEFIEECVNNVCLLEDIVPRYETHDFYKDEQEDIEEKELSSEKKDKIRLKIQWIRDQPQPQQRSSEWYEFRHGLISASNIWKVFSTECQQNSLIYEKCQPVVVYSGGGLTANVTSSLHWGVKYEPLSLMIYKERMGGIETEDFGCIRHSSYEFIGASPDGIVTDESSLLYGRMVEIKNVVNRVIDGVPSMAYWTQMQVQMETCDLDTCDFVETQFKEYESADIFWEEVTKNPLVKKGIVIMFENTFNQQIIYKFMPLYIPLTTEYSSKWIESIKTEMIEENYTWKETQYWYLDIFSCVTVRRNRRWFHSLIPIVENIWKTILEEREKGHHHRAPKKRQMKEGGRLQGYIVNKIDE